MSEAIETITLAGGCFWCVEAVFEQVRGVVDVPSGYSNGHVAAPTYEDVCTGTNNPEEGYCAAVIGPELEKFRKVFRSHLLG